MPRIEIYTTSICPYCVAAKNFVVGKGWRYEEIRVDTDHARFAEMLARSHQRRSVPQIFINNTHVGGYDDLIALDRAGGLEALLTQE